MNLIPEAIIVVNPVHTILSRKPNPKWACKHLGITIIDKANMVYQCTQCCPYGTVKVLPSKLQLQKQEQKQQQQQEQTDDPKKIR
jgi:hypothetical protein